MRLGHKTKLKGRVDLETKGTGIMAKMSESIFKTRNKIGSLGFCLNY